MGFSSCIHSLTRETRVCIYYASGTVLGTEAKTVNKIRFLLDCICKGVGVRNIN